MSFLKIIEQYAPEKKVSCDFCGKKSFFTQVCISKGNVDSISEESESTEEDRNFIISDGEIEFSFLMISEPIETNQPNNSLSSILV